jgi:glycosyltransferase involved in cell wall biosynthesis
MRPIRILELRCADGSGGGPEKTILLGSARTDPERFQITVCYLRDAHDTAFDIDQRAARLGLDFVELRQRHALDTAIVPALRRLQRQRGIDLVHAHDYKSNLLALLLADWDGVIPLSTAPGWTGHSWREQWVYYPADRRMLARFPCVIAVSRGIREELILAGLRPERVRTIVNGIDASAFRRDRRSEADVRARCGIAPGGVVIGAVGRLEPQKRFDILLQAFAQLHGQRSELRLVIAGEGGSRQALEAEIARLGLDGVCRLLGHCSDIPMLHHALNLFVQSSDYEGTSNAVLEAMALETPVVATTAGGTAELIEDGVHGLLVPPGNAQRLAEAMSRALVAPEKRVAAARARVEGPLSFDTRMRKVEAIYEELMATRRRTRLAKPQAAGMAG